MATSRSPRTTPISCLVAAPTSKGQSTWRWESVHSVARLPHLPKRLSHACVLRYETPLFRTTLLQA